LNPDFLPNLRCTGRPVTLNQLQVLEMKATLSKLALPLVAALGLLGACGGGDDDLSGSLTDFSVQPAEFTVSVAAAPCYAGYVADFFIVGGAPPYRVLNSVQDAVEVSTVTVDSKGTSFKVNFINGICVDPASVVVQDTLGRTVTVKLTNKVGT
jgi:hypothetical protein